MSKQILQELKELKSILAKLIGTSDLDPSEQFSIEAVNKAAKEYQKMLIDRGEWVAENDIGKYIRSSAWRAGAFIRNEFGFKNFIKKSHSYYYYKKDLIALGKELKERNVDLSRYIEFRESQAKFEKDVAAVSQGKKKKKGFQLPADLKDITTSPIPMPAAEIVKEDLERLKTEFFEQKFSEYIDIYKGNHAMMKFIYHFEKYIEPGLKRRCQKWVDNFNYANHALELITKKKEKFVPVKEEEMIQL
jgi:hypothetical protein